MLLVTVDVMFVWLPKEQIACWCQRTPAPNFARAQLKFTGCIIHISFTIYNLNVARVALKSTNENISRLQGGGDYPLLVLFLGYMFFSSYQHCLGLFPAAVAPLIRGFREVSCEGLLYAAFILLATPDIAVVGVFGDDLILPVRRCKTRNSALVPQILKQDEAFGPLTQNLQHVIWSFHSRALSRIEGNVQSWFKRIRVSLLSEFDACSA